MKITGIGVHFIRVPFEMGTAPKAFAGMSLTSVDSLFVRVRTDAGIDPHCAGRAAKPSSAGLQSRCSQPSVSASPTSRHSSGASGGTVADGAAKIRRA